MDRAAVLAAFDDQMREHADAGGAGRIETTERVVRHLGGDGQGWSAVVWSRLTVDDADAEIAAQQQYFGELGREVEWKHYDYDSPADLSARLAAAGFVPGEPEALMVAEVAALPTEMVLPDGVRLAQVHDADGIAAMVRASNEAFGADHATMGADIWAALQADPAAMVVGVLFAGDRPVTSGRLELPPGKDFASVWGGGTVAEWRHRGLYRALLAWRTAVAAERGYRWLQVDASPDSEPILNRLGFARLATTTPYVWRPAAH